MAKEQLKKATNKNTQNENRPMGMSKITEEDENKTRDVDEEINSGFGSYLRSSEGLNETTNQNFKYSPKKKKINETAKRINLHNDSCC